MKRLILFSLLVLAACGTPEPVLDTPTSDVSPETTQTPTRIFPTAVLLTETSTQTATVTATKVAEETATAEATWTTAPTPTIEVASDLFLLHGVVTAERGLNIRASNDAKSEIVNTLPTGSSIWYYKHRPQDAQGGWKWARVVERLPFEFHFIFAEKGWAVSEFIK